MDDFTRKINEKNRTINDLGKVPPQAVDIEESLLGTMMNIKSTIVETLPILKPEHFYKDVHEKIYQTIVEIFTDGLEVDMITVIEGLRKKDELEAVGGAYYISQLSMGATSINASYNARIIQQQWIKREIIKISHQTAQMAYEHSTDAIELFDELQMSLLGLKVSDQKSTHAKDIVIENLEATKKLSEDPKSISGLDTGIMTLNKFTLGWQNTDLIILAGRPGMGKTAFALTQVKYIALDNEIPCVFFSLEMDRHQLIYRLQGQIMGWNYNKAKNGYVDQDEYKSLQEASKLIERSNFIIDDSSALNIVQIRSKAIELKMAYDIKIIFVDYLQLMSGVDKNTNREGQIAEISRGLKSLAKDLGVPIIAISQLNRSVESRGGDKRPKLSDLRESGAIEQDADIVCLLYRPGYYKITEDGDGNKLSEGFTILELAKHRNGMVGDIDLMFSPNTMSFSDLEPDEVVENTYAQDESLDIDDFDKAVGDLPY